MATITADNGAWGNWQITRVKGDSGNTGFKSTVFKRSNEKPNKPADSDGSYNKPVPEFGGWEDSIPTGSTETLWACTRFFCSDSAQTDASWSEPARMTDTAGFEVIYGGYSASTAGLPAPGKVSDGYAANGWYDLKILTFRVLQAYSKKR